MSFDTVPTLADFEDMVRQMLAAENRLRPAIGTPAVLQRRYRLTEGMHRVIDRVTAECRADDENDTATITVPAQRTHADQPATAGGSR